MSKGALLLLGFPGLALLASAALAQEDLPSLGTLIVPTLVIMILVLVNGFFVAAEFAIIGVRPSKVEQKVEEGDQRAVGVMKVLDSPAEQDRYIATAQVGITIASLGLGMYGEPEIAHFIEPYMARLFGSDIQEAWVHTVGTIIALSLMTYLHVVIGEMVPKSLALASSYNMAVALAQPMRAVEWLFRVPVRMLNGVGNLLLRVLRVPPAHGHARLHSPEEIELIVAESAEGGMLNEDEHEMILKIFDFSERQVGQVMTPRPRVQAIPHDISPAELLQLVTKSQHSRFPVYEGDLDHVIGILHIRDLVRQQLAMRGEKFDIRLILRPAPAVPEDHPVEKLLAAFKRQHIHMAIVIDEFGGAAGIVTLEDLVEEVVGEVRDEFDVEKDPRLELEPGVLEVAGTYLLDDLKEEIYLGQDAELPDVETVGGLVVTELGRPPQVGDRVTLAGNVHFLVLDVDGLAVGRVKVEYPPPKSDEETET
jgi:CBS domain containing-hemolysin-like protein